MSIAVYTKVLQITLSADQLAQLKHKCGSGLAVSSEVRCWINRDIATFKTTYLSRPFDMTPVKLMIRIEDKQWFALKKLADKHYTYPARIVRQIITDRLKNAPSQQKLMK